MCYETRWLRTKGCLKSQVIFRKRATNHSALLRKMTYKDEATYASSPPCSALSWCFLIRSLSMSLSGKRVSSDLFCVCAMIVLFHSALLWRLFPGLLPEKGLFRSLSRKRPSSLRDPPMIVLYYGKRSLLFHDVSFRVSCQKESLFRSLSGKRISSGFFSERESPQVSFVCVL